MKMLFKEQIDYLSAVTDMLNGTTLPKSNEYHVKVLLVDTETETIVARWDDEHSSDDWGVEFVTSTGEDDRIA